MQALLIIDMQAEMQARIDRGQDHVNTDAPARITALAAAYRARGLPVLHVRHADPDPRSSMHPANAGYPPLPCDTAIGDEAVFVKNTSSAFASTPLADHLRAQGIGALAVVGAVAGFCVNSTVRAGADLGFAMTVVTDAVIGFDLQGLPAQTIFDVTMAHLGADFAQLTDSAALLSAHPI